MSIKSYIKKTFNLDRPESSVWFSLSTLVNSAFPNASKSDKSALLQSSSGFAYALTNRIANDCAMIPLRLMTTKVKSSGLKTKAIDNRTKDFLVSDRSGLKLKSADDVQEVESHDIIDLLGSMNDYDDGIGVMTDTHLQLLHIANAYWLADRAEGLILDPQRLHLLSGDKVTIELDNSIFRTIKGYRSSETGKNHDPKEIVRFKYSNSNDWLYGQSPLSAAVEFYNTSGNLAVLLKELSKNKNGLDLYLKKDKEGRELTPDQTKDVKEQIANYRMGKMNVDQIMYFAGHELIAIPNMNRDLPFIENLKGLFKFICWTFGVPDSLLASESSNRSIQKESIKDYYASCIQPKLIRFQSTLNSSFIPMFKGAKEQGLFIVFEDCIPIDVELLLKEVDMGTLSINEFREIRKRDAIPGGEELYINSNRIPISQAGQTLAQQGKEFAEAVKKGLDDTK